MKRFIVLMLVIVSGYCYSQVEPLPLKPDQQKRLLEQSELKDEHLLLQRLAGRWNINFQIPQPNKEDIYGKGYAENSMIFGGKFLKMEQSLYIYGAESNTMRIMGYNNFQRKFFLFIIEQENTAGIYCEGDYDKKTNMLVFKGQKYDPLKNKVSDFQIEIVFERENKFTYTNYNIVDNRKVLSIRLVFIKEE